MTLVEAIYKGGVFKPLSEVGLPDNQLVRLGIEPIEKQGVRAWVESVRDMHQRFVEQHGFLPDTTPDIAADRVRDE